MYNRNVHKKAACKIGGFTLLELVISVAIVGILSAIAVPAYDEYLIKARRSDAKTTLMAFAGAMERHSIDNIINNTGFLGAAAGNANSGPPAIFPTQSPLDGGTKYYNLTIKNTTTATFFTLVATPIGRQAGDGILEVDNTGARRWDEDNSGGFGATENDWEAN